MACEARVILFHLGYGVTLLYFLHVHVIASSILSEQSHNLFHKYGETAAPLFCRKQNKELQSSPMKSFHIILAL